MSSVEGLLRPASPTLGPPFVPSSTIRVLCACWPKILLRRSACESVRLVTPARNCLRVGCICECENNQLCVFSQWRVEAMYSRTSKINNRKENRSEKVIVPAVEWTVNKDVFIESRVRSRSHFRVLYLRLVLRWFRQKPLIRFHISNAAVPVMHKQI